MTFTKSKFENFVVIKTAPIPIIFAFGIVILATVGAISAERSDILTRMEAAQLVVASSPEYVRGKRNKS